MKGLTLFIIVVLLVLILTLLLGCMNRNFTRENFEQPQKKKQIKKKSVVIEEEEDDDEDDTPIEMEEKFQDFTGGLTQKEKDLFNDLKNNSLSTDQITDLVKGGVLTEKLVEKFLVQLDNDASTVTKKSSDPVKKKSGTAIDDDDEDDLLEGFTNGGQLYASVS